MIPGFGFCFRTLKMLPHYFWSPFWWEASFHSDDCSPLCDIICYSLNPLDMMFRSLTTMDGGIVFFVIILMNIWLQLWLMSVYIWFLKLRWPLLPGGRWGQTHAVTRPLNKTISGMQGPKTVRPWHSHWLGISIDHETSTLWVCRTKDHEKLGLWNDKKLTP